MSVFKAFRDVSNNFEEEWRKVSGELTSVNTGGSFEDFVSKKTSDITLLTAKLRLLQAKRFAVTPDVTEKEKGEPTINEYEEAVVNKILEQMTVKSLTQMNAVRQLITAPDSSLHPELADRKRKIMESLNNFKEKENFLSHLYSSLKERELEYDSARTQWERESLEMCERRTSTDIEVDTSGPLYGKLVMVVSKLEMMRWLLGRLLMLHTPPYNWLADPSRQVNTLDITRQHNTVEMFTADL